MLTNLFLLMMLFNSSPSQLGLFPIQSMEINSLNQEEAYEGNVIAINADSISVTVKKDESTVKFIVNAETKITRNGKPVTLSSIQVSDSVKVMAVQGARKLTAKMITANAAE